MRTLTTFVMCRPWLTNNIVVAVMLMVKMVHEYTVDQQYRAVESRRNGFSYNSTLCRVGFFLCLRIVHPSTASKNVPTNPPITQAMITTFNCLDFACEIE